MSTDIEKAIGFEALLEATAEECAELIQAIMKLNRKHRGTNPTPKEEPELIRNLNEEIADVLLCIDQLLDSEVVSGDTVQSFLTMKKARWESRLGI